jgi:hypothetical protein
MKRLITCLALLTIAAVLNAAEATQRKDLQLFLLIGQSNMAGRGVIEPQDKVPHPRVFVLTKELTWAPAVDPLHYDKPERIGVGLASSFGRSIAGDQPRAAVGLIPAAFGGTSLDEWKPGGALYTEAVKRARVAMKQGTLVGILWHQGEEDAAPERAATYPERFAAMIAQLRSDLEAKDVPVVVGEIGRFVENSSAINEALAKIPAHVPRSAFVSSERLTDKGDKLHFDSAALREFGRRYAEAWKAMWARPVP